MVPLIRAIAQYLLKSGAVPIIGAAMIGLIRELIGLLREVVRARRERKETKKYLEALTGKKVKGKVELYEDSCPNCETRFIIFKTPETDLMCPWCFDIIEPKRLEKEKAKEDEKEK